MKRQWLLAFAATGLVLVAVKSIRCGGKWPQHEGKIRQTAHVQVSNVRRGAKAQIAIGAVANYTVHDSDAARTTPVKDFDNRVVTLIDSGKKVTPIEVEWQNDSSGAFTLPADLPDGDYKLHAELRRPRSASGELDVAAAAVHAGAHPRDHRSPALRAGQHRCKFRAVVLRARDLAPLDGRPGPLDRQGSERRGAARGEGARRRLGRRRGHVPARQGAPTGTWHVAWVVGDAIDDVAVHRRAVHAAAVPRRRRRRQAVLPARRRAGRSRAR